jgi:RNA polymerase sigma-70 factor (ECF subfamily)
MTDQEYIDDFNKLYDHFFDLIYRFVARRIADKETVHDIVSETFLKVYLHKNNFIPKQNGGLSAWIYTIAKNEIYQYLRKGKNKKMVSWDDTVELREEEWFGEIMDQTILHDRLMQVLEELQEDDKELILYKYFDELSNGEIAALLHISANTLGVRLHRAMQRLKTILADHHITL